MLKLNQVVVEYVCLVQAIFGNGMEPEQNIDLIYNDYILAGNQVQPINN